MTLETLNLPFVDKLLEMKKLEKAKSTYLGQFARESFKGVMHPFFDLHIPVSYRSSSSMPNFQNLPKRDPEIGNLIRKGIIPSPDCVICEADFSGAEVITSVCYHKDRNFYNYLTKKDENGVLINDMHRDNATDLWMLPSDMLTNPDYDSDQKKKAKMIRFFAKNCWTFAQFYGDWFKSCGEALWDNCIDGNLELPTGILLKDHLESQGIYDLGEMTEYGPTEGSFLEHCAHVEDKMWNERFPEYTQWKKDIVTFYQKYGYIETFFGFRFVGYMDSKQCCNFPIQGTSFHLLVYTLIMVDKFIRKHKLRTKLIGQIHDSIIADVHKDELQFYLKGVNDIVTGLQNKFKWLIVPMEIEAEITQLREDGGNFSELKEVDPLNPKLW
jgi:DNA polymerase-1